MGLFSGFNINPMKNTNIALGSMMPGGILLANKNKTNADIDAQMVNPGNPAGMLDPNDMGAPPAGGSAYARMQHQQNALAAQQQGQQASQASFGDAAGQRSALAARGGLSSGASERIGAQAMANQANARQQTAAGMNNANLQGDIADEGMRRSAYNTMRMHNQEMQNQIYGGNQMSNATLQANRPKGLLGMGFLGL